VTQPNRFELMVSAGLQTRPRHEAAVHAAYRRARGRVLKLASPTGRLYYRPGAATVPGGAVSDGKPEISGGRWRGVCRMPLWDGDLDVGVLQARLRLFLARGRRR
jgi:hypothetical protein